MLLVIAILLIDQIIKILVKTGMELHESIRITGTEGEILVDHFHYADRAVKITPKGEEVFKGETSMLCEFDMVSREIREGRKTSAFVPPQVTMDVMEIMDE